MLSLVPSFKLTEQKTELIFLVDRSGSMGGPGIRQAKQALKVYLNILCRIAHYLIQICFNCFTAFPALATVGLLRKHKFKIVFQIFVQINTTTCDS